MNNTQKEQEREFIQLIYTVNQTCCSLGVARYTDVTVQCVPRFGGHGSIRFRYNMKKKEIYNALFLFIYFEQTVVQIKKIHLDVKILHIITCYIYIQSVLFSQIKADLYTEIINTTKCLKLILLV